MEIIAKCIGCGKQHVAENPEGETSANFKCDCGQRFTIIRNMSAFGKAFLYGSEELRHQRPSHAAMRFATSFESFQKQYLEAVLRMVGTPSKVARFLCFDVELTRGQYSQIAGFIFHEKLPQPDVTIRNRAAHHNIVPSVDNVVKLGDSVLAFVADWICSAERYVSSCYSLLWHAYSTGKKSPREVPDYDYSVFDFKMGYLILVNEWETEKLQMKLTKSATS